MTKPFCAVTALEAGEELVGTATTDTDVWILLEYRKPWAPKPIAPAKASDEVKAHLASWQKHVARSRLQLVRRPEREKPGDDPPPRFFVGLSDERDPVVLEIPIERYEDLLAIDLARVVATRTHASATRLERPLHLVCTHGLRDRCCAKWGCEAYDGFLPHAADDVWQTTHVGGHRFAANVVSLPHGICYGRVGAEHAERIALSHLRGEIFDLDHLRGRTSYDAAAQAADTFLRRRLGGERTIDAVRHAATERTGDERWTVHFLAGGAEHAVKIARETTGATRPSSCGDEPEPVHRWIEV